MENVTRQRAYNNHERGEEGKLEKLMWRAEIGKQYEVWVRKWISECKVVATGNLLVDSGTLFASSGNDFNLEYDGTSCMFNNVDDDIIT